ncbi:MAG TPA: acetate--CoA ligase [Phycisphaerae bacterium]|jgi:acetyl-CoA synthetase|nr:acetate--CoA ligase [Phycisphaerae bacterium]HOJ56440.1 acetate--CoA ligase [Phycisphaerae bacterium]HOL27999.1 acetate--CoA ligase [Phycisphaerae bacterium]HPP22414.1 acetate--CoA ligase [Phycisphaerae bacterium]HPU34239.1 acetate--CoA ligase [Phycisphaerae bacterium]
MTATSIAESGSARLFPPPTEFTAKAHVSSLEQYRRMYRRSIEDPEGFWSEIARRFHWQQPWTRFREYDFKDSISIQFFIGGKTNISYNALDRHLATRGDKVAILWEGNSPGEDGQLTYRELHAQVCRFANVLKSRGVKKGDRVSIYMPMVKEAAVAMLACARIGAIHSVVFGGFSAESLADRIVDSGCETLITADGTYRGAKPVPLKNSADEAMEKSAQRGVTVKTCIVLQRVGEQVHINMRPGRDIWWHEAVKTVSSECPPEWMDAEDPLFILYTSGSTGKPKGVLHTTGGYMVYATTTFEYVFDYHEDDIYWCTADVGWVTGHSYVVYGPLCAGATTLMFEGIPTYPDPGRFWDIIDKHNVTVFYTAPTAIRALMREGEDHPNKRSLASLRLLGTVGEPINPEAWLWYHRAIGRGRCPIVDTWWQTETGGIMITPLPGAIPQKPGSATLPFFGVKPVVLSPDGQRIDGPGTGVLCIEEPWPGIMRSVYGQHQRFKETYFSSFSGLYFTGDGCRRDEDGYYWITGRVDDVINVSGHRMGTAEVESALVSHPAVAEAAVVGFSHQIKGQGIYAYVTLKAGQEYSDQLKAILVQHVRKQIGPIAAPDVIHWAPALPKTRSGKIMRRILRKIAEGEPEQIGDVTTLADPSVVEKLIKNR